RRVEYPGAIYHVMNRGDRQEPIFKDEEDRERFLATLTEACGKTGWQVHAYCLMSNHFHLVVETPQANLVAGMKWFLGVYKKVSVNGIDIFSFKAKKRQLHFNFSQNSPPHTPPPATSSQPHPPPPTPSAHPPHVPSRPAVVVNSPRKSIAQSFAPAPIPPPLSSKRLDPECEPITPYEQSPASAPANPEPAAQDAPE